MEGCACGLPGIPLTVSKVPARRKIFDGIFIKHHGDKHLDICNCRYWSEYHQTNLQKFQSTDYHILQPSQYSEDMAKSMGLVSYREWMQIDGWSVTIHEPFNFGTLNNRKRRDQVSKTDWMVLQDRETLYHNPAPKLTQRIMSIKISQAAYKNVKGNQEVQSRCETLMFNSEFTDTTLRDF
jgi:hypothetical protein